MSMLGKLKKQPYEVNVLSITYNDSLTPSDELVSVFTFVAPKSAANWDQVVQSSPYTTLASDDGRILVATANVTGYAGALDGYTLCVSNQSQNAVITVCGFTVQARGAVIVQRKAGAWVKVASTNSILVNSVGDQRVRTYVAGGADGATYKAQVTVTTSEGLVLQGEFLISVKEV